MAISQTMRQAGEKDMPSPRDAENGTANHTQGTPIPKRTRLAFALVGTSYFFLLDSSRMSPCPVKYGSLRRSPASFASTTL